MDSFVEKTGLGDILEKVRNDERLSIDDGIRLFNSPALLAVGYLANIVRERKNIHPDLPYSYYTDLLKVIKEERPEVHIQAFTCVEIAHLAEISGLGAAGVLQDLQKAGLGSIPGGGAEVFSPRIRELTCEKKLSGDGWLEVAKAAHRNGLHTNATMLYGHIETIEERLEHLDMLRRAQDETDGFLAFIPLAFHPKNTELAKLSRTSGVDDLKNIAVARCFLDNFPHIKAYWVMIGQKLSQIALSFGADDVDGTVKEEVITHMAGTDPRAHQRGRAHPRRTGYPL
jgi:aminodeoxyfutalosine synthase